MVAIDMPMPKSCEKCKFLQRYISALGNKSQWCGINHNTLYNAPNTRPAHCPLIDMSQYEDDLK